MILYGHYIQSYPNIYNHHMQQQKNKLHLKTLTDKVSLKRCFSCKKLILKQKQTWVNLSSFWFRLHFYHVVYVSTVKCIYINFLTITLFYHQRTPQKIYALYVLSLFTLKGNEILQNEDEQLIFFFTLSHHRKYYRIKKMTNYMCNPMLSISLLPNLHCQKTSLIM